MIKKILSIALINVLIISHGFGFWDEIKYFKTVVGLVLLTSVTSQPISETPCQEAITQFMGTYGPPSHYNALFTVVTYNQKGESTHVYENANCTFFTETLPRYVKMAQKDIPVQTVCCNIPNTSAYTLCIGSIQWLPYNLSYGGMWGLEEIGPYGPVECSP